MNATKFLSKVLSDGHLSLPKNFKRKKGQIFEVIIMPVEESNVYSYCEELSHDKEFYSFTEQDIEKIIHQSRKVNE